MFEFVIWRMTSPDPAPSPYVHSTATETSFSTEVNPGM